MQNDILPPLTTVQQWIEATRSRMTSIGQHAGNIIGFLQSGFDDLWQRPDEEINAIFTFLGAEKTISMLTLHYNLGTVLNETNAALVSMELASPRQCSTAKPRELRVNDAGDLEVVPLPPSVETPAEPAPVDPPAAGTPPEETPPA